MPKHQNDAEEKEAADEGHQHTPRDSSSGELPPLPVWLDKEYTSLKKELHGIRKKVNGDQPEREPFTPYCFNSLLAYTNTDVPHYQLYKRYEEPPGLYCQRRTALRITDPEMSWKMDNVLYLSDFEMYHKPLVSDPEDEEEEEEEAEEGEGEGEGEEGENEGEEGENEEDGEAKQKKKEKKTQKKSKTKKSKDKQKGKTGANQKKQKKDAEDQQDAQEKKEEDGKEAEEETTANDESNEVEGTGDTEKDEQEKKRKEELRKEREEIQYSKAKAIWVSYNLDYIFEKPEKTQDRLLLAVRKHKHYLKDIKEKVWEKLVSERRDVYNRMVQKRQELEYALKHGKSHSGSSQKSTARDEEDGTQKESSEDSKQEDSTQSPQGLEQEKA